MEAVIDRMLIFRQWSYGDSLPIKAYFLTSSAKLDKKDIKKNLYLPKDFSEFFAIHACAICFVRGYGINSKQPKQFIDIATILDKDYFASNNTKIKYASMTNGKRVRTRPLLGIEQKIVNIENKFRQYIIESAKTNYTDEAIRKNFTRTWPRLNEDLVNPESELAELCAIETVAEVTDRYSK